MTNERIRALADEAVIVMKVKLRMSDTTLLMVRGRIEQAIREALAEAIAEERKLKTIVKPIVDFAVLHGALSDQEADDLLATIHVQRAVVEERNYIAEHFGHRPTAYLTWTGEEVAAWVRARAK